MRATPGGNRPADPHSIELQSGPPAGQETTSRAASRRHSSSGTVGKSLIKMLNRAGPNIDPWGTPCSTHTGIWQFSSNSCKLTSIYQITPKAFHGISTQTPSSIWFYRPINLIEAFLTLSKDLRAGVSWWSGFTLSFAGRRFFCSPKPQYNE